MAKRNKISNKKIVDTYEKKGCNISATATALGIDRKTFSRWRQSSKTLDEMLTEAEESILDFTESKLIEKINDGDLTAIIFMLKTKGKKRGYIEGQFITGNITTSKAMSQEEAIDFLKSLEQDY